MLFAIGKSDFLWKRFQRIIGAWLKVKGFDLLKIGIVGLVYGANPLIKTSSWLRTPPGILKEDLGVRRYPYHL